MTDSSADEAELAELVGSIQDRMNDGERVDLEEIKAEFPQFSDDLESYFNCGNLFDEALDDSERISIGRPDEVTANVGAFPVEERLPDIAIGTVHLLSKAKDGKRRDLVVLHPWLTPEQHENIEASVRHTMSYQFEAFVPVLELGRMKQTPYVLREHFSGQSLSKIMDDVVAGGGAFGMEKVMFGENDSPAGSTGKLSRAEVAARLLANSDHIAALLNVFRAWSYALDQAHKRGLVHCEIEPRNLMIDHDGQCAVGGSGFSWHGTGIEPSSLKHWCPNWLAPEVVDSSWGNVTWMADVYGLGRGLAACLSLNLPDEDDDPDDTLMRISVGDRTWLDELPAEIDDDLRELIEEATFPDQSRRLKSLALFGRKLAALVPEDKRRARKGWAGRFFGRA
ncbi:MAG: serine/threonine protein kinase [Planctomycetota bacterium]|jgi:serine/threonine protein kinase